MIVRHCHTNDNRRFKTNKFSNISLNKQTNLVVAGDGNVHVAQRRVRVAEGNHGDVDIRPLRHRLVVQAWVRHDEQTRLTKRSLSKCQYRIVQSVTQN